MSHELQHHIPQFFLDPWSMPGKDNEAFVEPIFRCGQNKTLQTSKLSKNQVCSGYHMWSYDEQHPDRTQIERVGLQDIDSNGAKVITKLRTGVPLVDNEIDELALFISSLYSRYPEVVGRLVMEARTIKLDILTDPEIYAHNIDHQTIWKSIESRMGDSIHNYSLSHWENIHLNSPLRQIINESNLWIINAPQHDLIPITDRPLFFPRFLNKNGNFFLMIALNQHSILCIHKGDHNRRIIPNIKHSKFRRMYRLGTLSQTYMFSFDRRPILSEYQKYFTPRFVIPEPKQKFFNRKTQMREPLVTYREFYHDDGAVNLLINRETAKKELEELKEHESVLRNSFGGRGLIMPF